MVMISGELTLLAGTSLIFTSQRPKKFRAGRVDPSSLASPSVRMHYACMHTYTRVALEGYRLTPYYPIPTAVCGYTC